MCEFLSIFVVSKRAELAHAIGAPARLVVVLIGILGQIMKKLWIWLPMALNHSVIYGRGYDLSLSGNSVETPEPERGTILEVPMRMEKKGSKCLIRVIAAVSSFTIGSLLLLNLLDATVGIDPKVLDDLQRPDTIAGIFGLFLGLAGSTSIMALWVLMLWHWGTHQFESAHQRKVWFVALILGMVLGGLVYYFVVYELRRTLRVENQE